MLVRTQKETRAEVHQVNLPWPRMRLYEAPAELSAFKHRIWHTTAASSFDNEMIELVPQTSLEHRWPLCIEEEQRKWKRSADEARIVVGARNTDYTQLPMPLESCSLEQVQEARVSSVSGSSFVEVDR